MKPKCVTLVIESDPSAVLDAMERFLEQMGFQPAISGTSLEQCLILRLEPHARGLAIRLDCSGLSGFDPPPCAEVGRYLAKRFGRVDLYADNGGLFHFVGGELVIELQQDELGECQGVPWSTILRPGLASAGPDRVRDAAVRELGPAGFWALQAHKPTTQVVSLAMTYRLGERTGTSSFANAYQRL